MKKRKLNYHFHNPNTAATTADYILKIFMEVNADKVERAIREAAEQERGNTGSEKDDQGSGKKELKILNT